MSAPSQRNRTALQLNERIGIFPDSLSELRNRKIAKKLRQSTFSVHLTYFVHIRYLLNLTGSPANRTWRGIRM